MKTYEEAKSKSQQRLFGMALAHARGELDLDDLPNQEIRDKVKELSDLPEDKLEEYASTKHEDLPEKVQEDLATLTNTLGMGNVVLPTDGNLGSGDIPTTPGDDSEEKNIKNSTSTILTFQEFLEKSK